MDQFFTTLAYDSAALSPISDKVPHFPKPRPGLNNLSLYIKICINFVTETYNICDYYTQNFTINTALFSWIRNKGSIAWYIEILGMTAA